MKKINEYIDHTLLKSNATEVDIVKLCKEALKYNFKSVCINPFWVSKARDLLLNSEVLTCTVVGFPLGANTTTEKILEAREAISDGAQEIDVVANIGLILEQKWAEVLAEISAIKNACLDLTLKVIVETCLLDDDLIAKVTEIVNESGADFIKTSTGFSTGGATESDIQIMNDKRNHKLQIKASGGIRDYKRAKLMISLGANRIGTSSGVQIVREEKNGTEIRKNKQDFHSEY